MLEAYSLRYWFVLLAALALLHLGTQLALIVVRLLLTNKWKVKMFYFFLNMTTTVTWRCLCI